MGLGIGTGEILLVLIVALIIWGPGRLPEIARTLGKTVRALKKASSDFTTAITREITAETDTKAPEKATPPEPERSHHTGKASPPPRTASPTTGTTPPPAGPASPPPGSIGPQKEEKPSPDVKGQQS
ncbi:MAG: twin-arginine translocase TatA/TatE family subunit [Chloroflexota bacterium]